MLSVGALAITSMIGFTAFAATAEPTAPATSSAATSTGICERISNRRASLTDEQKAEMTANREERKAKFEASKAKWDALTAAQKEELYALTDKEIDAKIQKIDKSLELGIIDADTATKMKENLTQRKTDMREDGRMPLMGRGGRGGRIPRGENCPVAPAQ